MDLAGEGVAEGEEDVVGEEAEVPCGPGVCRKCLKKSEIECQKAKTNEKDQNHKPVGIILPCTGQHRGIVVECMSHEIDDNTTSVSDWIPHGCIVGKKGSEMCSIYLILLRQFLSRIPASKSFNGLFCRSMTILLCQI